MDLQIWTSSTVLILLLLCKNTKPDKELEHIQKDPAGLVEIEEGDDNIVISVPHGGYLTPAGMVPRERGCRVNDKCVFKVGCQPKSSKCKIVPRRDINAYQIGKALVARLKEKGRKPHAVFMLLHRKFIDPNRPPNEACQGIEKCLAAYNRFHDFIKAARRKISGPGLYIDVHTIRHKADWTELGYRVSKQALNETGPLPELPSSIDQLRRRTGISLEELVRGNRSLGQLLTAKGYDVIPSPKFQRPGVKGYARGGFNTLMYGSISGGCIDGIQVEGSLSIRLGGEAVGTKFGTKLADAVLEFMKDFGYDDRNTVCAGSRTFQSIWTSLAISSLVLIISR